MNPGSSSLLKDGWTPNELAREIPLTRSGREVVDHAQVIAGRAGAARVEPEHLLLAVLSLRNGLAVRALKALGKDPDTTGWTKELHQSLATAPGRPLVGSAARYILFNGLKEAQLLGHYRVDSMHILMGLLYKGTPTAEPLEKSGVSLYDLRQYLQAPGAGVGGLRRRPLPSFDGAITVSPVFAIPAGAFVLGAVGLFLNPSPELIAPFTVLLIVGGWVTSVCIHEFSHALIAYLGGDRSVAAAGYLSFNPLKYTDPLWSIVVPLVFVFLTGFGLPGGGVYINRRVLRSRWWDTASSLAGPFGHAVFAALVVAPFWFNWTGLVTEQNKHFWMGLAFLAFVLVSSVIFNLLPIPGIDGFGALLPWLPIEWRAQATRIGYGGLFLIWFLVFVGGGFGIWHVITQAADALHVPLSLVYQGRAQLMP